MAITERRILDLIISKFNEEYTAQNKAEDFLIYSITPHNNYQYGFEAKATVNISNEPIIRYRLYFNIGPMEQLPKFKLTAVDDNLSSEEYTFVTQGNIDRAIVADSNLVEPITNYDGTGIIDPTIGSVIETIVGMELAENQW